MFRRVASRIVRNKMTQQTQPVKQDDLICRFFFCHFDSMAVLTTVAPETSQYTKSKLDRGDLDLSPVTQFHQWFQEAKSAQIPIPEACNFATARLPSGRVSSRTVLLKELDKDGHMVIYSNWDQSKKAQDIRSNGYAAVTFFWKELERQVRVEGTTEFLSNEESQIYFDTRPRASRIGAWASPQSQVLQSREELDAKVAEIEKRFEGVERIPCPPFWGGIRIQPLEWEFFQGRKNRTHDRFVYTRDSIDDPKWTVNRIAS